MLRKFYVKLHMTKERVEFQIEKEIKQKATKIANKKGFGGLSAWIRNLIVDAINNDNKK